MALGPPPATLAKRPLPAVAIAPAKLFRMTRYDASEPFIGKRAANRFDDPGRPAYCRTGTCYLGLIPWTLFIAPTTIDGA